MGVVELVGVVVFVVDLLVVVLFLLIVVVVFICCSFCSLASLSNRFFLRPIPFSFPSTSVLATGCWWLLGVGVCVGCVVFLLGLVGLLVFVVLGYILGSISGVVGAWGSMVWVWGSVVGWVFS